MSADPINHPALRKQAANQTEMMALIRLVHQRDATGVIQLLVMKEYKKIAIPLLRQRMEMLEEQGSQTTDEMVRVRLSQQYRDCEKQIQSLEKMEIP
jgi:hypothetical protein